MPLQSFAKPLARPVVMISFSAKYRIMGAKGLPRREGGTLAGLLARAGGNGDHAPK